MGYSTEFRGELKFTTELTATQLAKVNSFLGEDCRHQPDWIGTKGLDYVNLELLKDFSGLQWNGAEKTHGMVQMVNMIIMTMRTKWQLDFGLKGKMLAQGEEIGDLWELAINEAGFAFKRELQISGGSIKCPNCGDSFLYEGK